MSKAFGIINFAGNNIQVNDMQHTVRSVPSLSLEDIV